MREIVILSGKGGTGKTTISGSLAVLASNKVMADCDVDAANLHLLLKPVTRSSFPFYGMPKARINREKCLECYLCVFRCAFEAIEPGLVVNESRCEGCAVCYHTCPCKAVEMVEHVAGRLHISDTAYGPLVHARLGAGEDNSGKLVTAVRREARRLAEEEKKELIITDGPPGIGCPAISCLAGVDLVLVVTEPTLAAKHDLERVLDLADHFGCHAVACINKCDLEPAITQEIERLCRQRSVPVVGELPYDEKAMEATKKGQPVVELGGPLAGQITALWREVKKILGKR
ncbi:ATP-binding protein [Desulfovirgula thermocuniculi]|uniref:ATP-binding protein n=1 Tax=Desulfovirgula thermocuniculi TaxID=348842 RepID=UPI00040EC26F|nr:ATP-binding protein [Desulfovirgula thermocuniculi]